MILIEPFGVGFKRQWLLASSGQLAGTVFAVERRLACLGRPGLAGVEL